MLEAFDTSIDKGFNTNALSALKTAIPAEFDANVSVNTSRMAEAAQNAHLSLVGQFKEALAEMKIEMDEREFGKFVDNTVTELVYN